MLVKICDHFCECLRIIFAGPVYNATKTRKPHSRNTGFKRFRRKSHKISQVKLWHTVITATTTTSAIIIIIDITTISAAANTTQNNGVRVEMSNIKTQVFFEFSSTVTKVAG